MKILYAFLFLLLNTCLLAGQIIRIPDDYPAIQDGINAACDGDTVLVSRGRYIENIRFIGKAITVASHYLIDPDTAHISNTIIDGSQPSVPDSASTVIFGDGEDSTSVLCGFTITGGGGTLYNNALSGLFLSGGGIIMLEKSGGTVEHNIIRDNHLISSNKIWGGGMLVMLGGDTGIIKTIIIQHNEIRNNSIASSSGGDSSGGGIKLGVGKRVEHGRIILQNNLISHNEVKNTANGNTYGGGMNFGMVLPTPPGEYIIRNNVFSHNKVSGSAWAVAGGFSIIHILESKEEFFDSVPAPVICNNIVCNNHSTGYAAGIVIYTNYMVNRAVNSVPQPVLVNNTIADNSSPSPAGIYSYLSNPVLYNNIFWNDLSAYNAGELYYSGEFHAFNNDVQGINPVGTNISEDPDFTEDYELSPVSPCIGAGTISVQAGGFLYKAPALDLYGSDRPHPIDNLPDMGAVESPYKKPATGIAAEFKIQDLKLYPSPVENELYIKTEEPVSSVEIFNTLGMRLNIFKNVDDRIFMGHLKQGIYLIRITTGNGLVCTAKILKK